MRIYFASFFLLFQVCLFAQTEAGNKYDCYFPVPFFLFGLTLLAFLFTLIFLIHGKKLQKALNGSKRKLTESLDNQKQLSDALWAFLQAPNENMAMGKILHDTLNRFAADRVCLFEVNTSLLSCNCIYESTSGYASPIKEKLQDIQFYDIARVHQKMQNNEIISAENMDVLRSLLHDDSELHALKLHNTRSLLYIPLNIGKALWGFIGIEYIRQEKKWTDQDLEYLQSIAQIIGMGIQHFRSEELKQETEIRFGYLYKNMPLGVCLFNKDAILSDANEVFLKLAGVPDKSKILGKSICQFQSMPKDAIEVLNRDEEISFDFQLHPSKWNKGSITTEHTSTHYFTVHIKMLRNANNGTISGYMMVWIDNTHLVRSQQKVSEIESLFTYASDMAKVGVALWNPLSRSGFATEQWYRNFNETGNDTKEIINTYSTVHPDDRKDLFAYCEKAQKGEATSFTKSIRVWNGNKWSWIEFHSILKTFDPENNRIEIACMCIDIDYLKQTEESLIEARAIVEKSEK